MIVNISLLSTLDLTSRRREWRKRIRRGSEGAKRRREVARNGKRRRRKPEEQLIITFVSQYIYVSLCFCVNVFFSQCMPIKHLEYAKHTSAYLWVDIIYHLPSLSIYLKWHIIGCKWLKPYPSNSVIVIFPPYYL